MLIAACVLLVAAPARADVTAAAVTAPSLGSPTGGASAVEGDSLTVTWTGALQGDPQAIDRAYFQVEVAQVDDVPSGTQSAWTTLENSRQTPAGETTQTVTLGVPTAGTYKWRVCAWGVVDVDVDNTIQQLPGGCSVARTLVTKAAAANGGTVGMVEQQNKVQVAQPVKVIRRTRQPAAAAPVVEPAPAAPVDVAPVAAPVAKPEFTQIVREQVGAAGSSSVTLPRRVKFDTSSDRTGVGGAIATGLGATLPGIPIPFWTLAMLMVAFPLARLWRRNVIDMFEWHDGTADGSGDPSRALQIMADDTSFKSSIRPTDTRATPSPRDRAA